MPTYQYLCRDCDHRFDTVQSIHDNALTVCPECGGTVRRVLHPVGITFKGSGFYRTDSREKKTATTPAGTQAGADSGSKDSGGAASGEGTSGGSGGESSGSTGATTAAKAAPAAKTSGSSPSTS